MKQAQNEQFTELQNELKELKKVLAKQDQQIKKLESSVLQKDDFWTKK